MRRGQEARCEEKAAGAAACRCLAADRLHPQQLACSAAHRKHSHEGSTRMTTVRSSVLHPARSSSSVGPSLPYRVSMRTRQPVSLRGGVQGGWREG